MTTIVVAPRILKKQRQERINKRIRKDNASRKDRRKLGIKKSTVQEKQKRGISKEKLQEVNADRRISYLAKSLATSVPNSKEVPPTSFNVNETVLRGRKSFEATKNKVKRYR